ncbi:MAG: hypothetical protein K0U86_02005 [Planctomycetes bacterium]|nr:hypothetical protein [Planctomycetota bacterium]MCH9723661.1 hypothetical protein [Planctomycetota bacterium]MCH9778479.1 hypothetical protein [Planctomycetota bacterium]MCH9791559.1 hypothetical protein [Planctomycetota bacterium]
MAPGLKTLVTGITLFILGMIVITMVIPILVYDLIDNRNGEQFKVPGITQVTIEEPGNYYLWNDYQTVFEGKSYTQSKTLPDGMEFKIRNQATGKFFNFVTDLSISSNRGMSSSNSIGYVEIPAPVKIEIEVVGGTEDRIFSFARSVFTTHLALIVCGALLSMAICFIGCGLVVWGIAKLVNSNKNDDEANSNESHH